MTEPYAIDMTVKAMTLVLWSSLPAIAVATVVGVAVSLVQALTQIQDQTLPFGIKLIAVFLAILSEALVGAIDPFIESFDLTPFFVGVILIPTIGNLAEHLVGVQLALKDKMDFSMSVSIGSSLQVALFVAPVLVLLGLVVGQPMDLVFAPLEVAAVAVAAAVCVGALGFDVALAAGASVGVPSSGAVAGSVLGAVAAATGGGSVLPSLDEGERSIRPAASPRPASATPPPTSSALRGRREAPWVVGTVGVVLDTIDLLAVSESVGMNASPTLTRRPGRSMPGATNQV